MSQPGKTRTCEMSEELSTKLARRRKLNGEGETTTSTSSNPSREQHKSIQPESEHKLTSKSIFNWSDASESGKTSEKPDASELSEKLGRRRTMNGENRPSSTPRREQNIPNQSDASSMLESGKTSEKPDASELFGKLSRRKTTNEIDRPSSTPRREQNIPNWSDASNMSESGKENEEPDASELSEKHGRRKTMNGDDRPSSTLRREKNIPTELEQSLTSKGSSQQKPALATKPRRTSSNLRASMLLQTSGNYQSLTDQEGVMGRPTETLASNTKNIIPSSTTVISQGSNFQATNARPPSTTSDDVQQIGTSMLQTSGNAESISKLEGVMERPITTFASNAMNITSSSTNETSQPANVRPLSTMSDDLQQNETSMLQTSGNAESLANLDGVMESAITISNMSMKSITPSPTSLSTEGIGLQGSSSSQPAFATTPPNITSDDLQQKGTSMLQTSGKVESLTNLERPITAITSSTLDAIPSLTTETSHNIYLQESSLSQQAFVTRPQSPTTEDLQQNKTSKLQQTSNAKYFTGQECNKEKPSNFSTSRTRKVIPLSTSVNSQDSDLQIVDTPRSRSFKLKKLTVPGMSELPSSVPLIYPNNGTYNLTKNVLSLDEDKPRSGFQVLPEALKLLESIQKPVAVVSICGPCRTGKSYILSRVLGSGDAFALGHTMNAKTFGIWMGTSVLECDEFTMLLMDTEGIDNVDAEVKDDAGILVLSVLLSSCFIYNSHGTPKKSDLNSMRQFETITRSIIEKPGDDGSTLSKHFPDFIWVLRDVLLLPATKDGRELPPTDFLIQQVLNHGKGKATTKADEVASAIMTSFPSVQCVTLPPPSVNAAVMENISSCEQDLNPDFNKGVEAFVHNLCDHVKAKSGYEIGKQVTGLLLAHMVTKYVEKVNEPGSLSCISDVWSVTINNVCTKNMEELLNEYDEEMRKIISERGLPMEEGDKQDEDKTNPTTLLGIHRIICQRKISTFIERVGHFMTSQNIGDLTSKFENALVTYKEVPFIDPNSGKQLFEKKIVGGSLKKYVDENYETSQVTSRAVFERLYGPIKKKTELIVGEESHYTFQEFLHDLQTLATEYHKKAVGPAKWDVYQEKKEYIEQNRKAFESLLGYQKKMFEEAQRVADAEARNRKFNETINSLQAQMNQQQDTNEKRLLQLQQHHESELDKMQKQTEEKLQAEKKHMEQMIQANMHEAQTNIQEKLEFQRKEHKEELQSIQHFHTQQMQQFLDKAEHEKERDRQMMRDYQQRTEENAKKAYEQMLVQQEKLQQMKEKEYNKRAEESARKANEAMALVQQENMKKKQELENRQRAEEIAKKANDALVAAQRAFEKKVEELEQKHAAERAKKVEEELAARRVYEKELFEKVMEKKQRDSEERARMYEKEMEQKKRAEESARKANEMLAMAQREHEKQMQQYEYRQKEAEERARRAQEEHQRIIELEKRQRDADKRQRKAEEEQARKMYEIEIQKNRREAEERARIAYEQEKRKKGVCSQQ